MNRSFIYLFVSRKVLYNFLLRSTIFFLTFLFIHSPNSYSQSLTAEQIYKKVSGAVVVVLAYNDNDELASQGSGVVLNDKGYVVTNYHVLSGNNKLEILHGKEIVPYVDIIGIDVEKDILILKIEAKKFPAIKIGDSKLLNVGQRIYAIGSPMGFENSISEGIISGLRSVDELKRNFIQITASISPGSSGGAVVNDKGELIGISTLTAQEGQNLNFAIPIYDALKVKIGSYSKNDEYRDFELFNKAFNASKRGDYHEAIKYYSLFIEKYPNHASSYNNRGIAKYSLTDYGGAIQDFNKAIEINPDDVVAYLGRGIAKYFLTDYGEAIQDFNKAIEINPSDAEAYLSRGFAKDELKDYTGAIQDYNKAIEINPNYAMAYYNRGIVKAKLSFYKEAIQDYNKAIELNPKDAYAYYNRGIAKGENESAIQDYSKAIEINPQYVDAYITRGNVKAKLSDYIGANQDYNKAIEINPNNATAYFNRGISRYALDDNVDACLDWNKAGDLGIAKAYDMIKEYCGKEYFESGMAKNKSGDYKSAIQDYNKAIELNPKDAKVFCNRGVAKVGLEDFRGAIQDFNKAITLNPNYGWAYMLRGGAKLMLKDIDGACLDWSKAGELGFAQAYDLIKERCK